MNVWPCCLRPGAAVADVHVAAGHVTAPCGIGARSTSRRALGRGLLQAQQHSQLRGAPAQRSCPEGCGGRRSGRVRFRCASRGTPWPAGKKKCSEGGQ